MARLPVIRTRIYYDSEHAAGVCLGTIQARTRSAGTCMSAVDAVPNTSYGLPCNTCTDTLGIWVMNVPIMPLHLVHWASFPVTTLPLAEFVMTLTHLPVVMAVTTSARFRKDFTALELKQSIPHVVREIFTRTRRIRDTRSWTFHYPS